MNPFFLFFLHRATCAFVQKACQLIVLKQTMATVLQDSDMLKRGMDKGGTDKMPEPTIQYY